MKVTRHLPFLRVLRLVPDFTQIFRDEIATVKVTFAFEETIFTPTRLARDLLANLALAFTVLDARSAAAACATKSTTGAGVAAGGVATGTAAGGVTAGGITAGGVTAGGVTAAGGVSVGGVSVGGMTEGEEAVSTIRPFHALPTAGKPVALAETVAFAPAATSVKACTPTGVGAFPEKTTLASWLAA